MLCHITQNRAIALLIITDVDKDAGHVDCTIESPVTWDYGWGDDEVAPCDVDSMALTVSDNHGFGSTQWWGDPIEGPYGWALASPDDSNLTPGQSTGVSGWFADPGILDRHTVTLWWESPTADPVSTFSLPAARDLALGDRFASTTDGATLTIVYVDKTEGIVGVYVSPHVYAGDGESYGINQGCFLVENDGGAFEVDYFGVVVQEAVHEKAPPTAWISGPYTVPEGSRVMLNGYVSYGPASQTLRFEWDLDGDGVFGETGPENALRGDEVGAHPVFSAISDDDPATFTVALRVTDAEGAMAEDTAEITVVNHAPGLAWFPSGYEFSGGSTSEVAFDFLDWGILDAHQMTLDWGDANAPAATFDLPAIAQLRAGDEFASTTDGSTLVVVDVHPELFGRVLVRVSSNRSVDDAPPLDNGESAVAAPVTVTVRDDDGGEASVTWEMEGWKHIYDYPFRLLVELGPWDLVEDRTETSADADAPDHSLAAVDGYFSELARDLITVRKANEIVW